MTDVVMPGGIGGRELAKRLHLRKPELRVILTSGYSADMAGQELFFCPDTRSCRSPRSQACCSSACDAVWTDEPIAVSVRGLVDVRHARGDFVLTVGYCAPDFLGTGPTEAQWATIEKRPPPSNG